MDPLTTASNTSYIPSAKDLLLVVPRLAQRAGSFALYHMPEVAGNIWNGGNAIADATAQQTTVNSTITNTSNVFAQSTAAVLGQVLSGASREAAEESTSVFGLVMQGILKLKNFGGIFSYLLSRWALMTFVVAIVLNRTQFYASSREPLRLRWYVRLALYMVPITAFVTQVLHILQFMRCQTSPDFNSLRWGDPSKNVAVDFGGEGGFLYQLSSTLLFWQDDATCCTARNMSLVGVNGDLSQLRGSITLLFWFFITLCTSQLFETLSCALQGRQPQPETGMTIFEHSLAFAECETMLTSALGFSLFGLPKVPETVISESSTSMTRLEILQRLNVPPEVLLVCLISCFSHLSSATLAITGLRNKVRLINTAIWSCCYMAAFLWSLITIAMRPVSTINDIAVLRFPTVCIVGFIPHLLILVGIVVCGAIYGLALLVTALSVPDEVAAGLSLRQRFGWAYHNLQANVQFSSTTSIQIRMSEDFYTTLLKIGFNILTAASEAVYLNEGSRIQVAQMTWVERKRIDEMASNIEQRRTPKTKVPPELLDGEIAKGLGHDDTQHAGISQSPYARERKSRPNSSGKDRRPTTELDTGLGMVQRRSRMQLTYDFASGIFCLLIGIQAQIALSLLQKLGFDRRPAWLQKAAGVGQQEQRRRSVQASQGQNVDLDFWMVGDDGALTLPRDDEVDVEAETRRRMQAFGAFKDEENLSNHLYQWWRSSGWFGSVDSSGEYQDMEHDDDTTSMISMSTNASTADDQWEIEDDRRRTPTQQDPHAMSREGTPVSDAGLDISMLSRLLNPQTASEQEEARLLSYSLQANRPMTRSQYRRDVDRSRAQLLTGLIGSMGNANATSEQDEERNLEQFIMAQRSKAQAKTARGATWETGAEGMGEGGPQCVVCQSTPRTVLVWPCGCLSMCDDCRVGLANRNFTQCICCRSEVKAYSRLYVP